MATPAKPGGKTRTVLLHQAPIWPSLRAPASRMVTAIPDHPSNADYWWHDARYIEEGKRCCCCMV